MPISWGPDLYCSDVPHLALGLLGIAVVLVWGMPEFAGLLFSGMLESAVVLGSGAVVGLRNGAGIGSVGRRRIGPRSMAASIGLAIGIGVAAGIEVRTALHRSAGVGPRPTAPLPGVLP